jgi:hypothetical protein
MRGYGTTAHGAKRPLHTQTAWNQARGGSAWPLTVGSGDINASVACANIGASVAAAFIPAEKSSRSVGDHCDVIPNPSAAASQNVSLYCRTRWNVGPKGIRTQVPNHSKRCYAASWGIARSTNRKNRALRVHATTDNSSSQGYIRRGRTTPGKPRLRRGRTGTIEVVRSQSCRLFSAMRDSNWVRDADATPRNWTDSTPRPLMRCVSGSSGPLSRNSPGRLKLRVRNGRSQRTASKPTLQGSIYKKRRSKAEKTALLMACCCRRR